MVAVMPAERSEVRKAATWARDVRVGEQPSLGAGDASTCSAGTPVRSAAAIQVDRTNEPKQAGSSL